MHTNDVKIKWVEAMHTQNGDDCTRSGVYKNIEYLSEIFARIMYGTPFQRFNVLLHFRQNGWLHKKTARKWINKSQVDIGEVYAKWENVLR